MDNKYHNRKITIDGMEFDSRKEARRYAELLLLQRGRVISDLERQKEYVLLPAQNDAKTGKCIERAVKYIADFVYIENGETVVEDTKGVKTKDYIIKRKLMLYVHGIRISEV